MTADPVPQEAILGVVPARGGSRRLPGKNLATIGGLSLVERALATTVAAACCAEVVLSSDDPKILAAGAGVDGVTSLRRPAELATATARTLEVVHHALHELESAGRGRFAAVVIVQCTSPFTAPQDIAGCVAMLRATGADSVVSVARVPNRAHPLRAKRLEGDRLLPYLADDEMAPSHELPELWARNGAIYVTRRDAIDAGQIVGEDVRGFVMPDERSIDIDTSLDLAFARFLAGRVSEQDEFA